MILRLLCCSLFLTGTMSLNAQKIKVMSYNIHHARNAKGEVEINRIADVIKNASADLIGLQEVDSVCTRSNKEDQMKRLAELTGMYYTFKKHFPYDGGSYGLGILSKYPIVKVYNHRISSYPDGSEKSLALLVTDIKIARDETVRFATVHFDYREDSRIRLQQATETINHLNNSIYPVILTGDLNAEPDKPEIKDLDSIFKDTDTWTC